MVREGNLLTQGVAANILGYRVAERNFSRESVKTMLKVNGVFAGTKIKNKRKKRPKHKHTQSQ